MSFSSRKDPKVILAVDVPNLDMITMRVTGERPIPANRPKYDVLKEFFEKRYPNADMLAAAFSNIRPDNYASVLGWAENFLRPAGYGVLLKPKRNTDDDIDEDIINWIDGLVNNPAFEIKNVVVVSHDSARFDGYFEKLQEQHIATTYAAFSEHLSCNPGLNTEIVDLRDIPGMPVDLWPDRRFEKIPDSGLWV
ncbi:hypothetical protein H0W80_02220 [Candidatus Saccharibacteria bacterium]|nr:hypothetical protein [Candidatus Saccharibacteria bacterium]